MRVREVFQKLPLMKQEKAVQNYFQETKWLKLPMMD